MAITFVNAGTGNFVNGTTTIGLTAPASMQTGDLVLAQIAVEATKTITGPDGTWSQYRVDTTGANQLVPYIWRHIVQNGATESGSTYTFGFSSVNSFGSAQVVAYRGTNSLDGSGAGITGGTNAATDLKTPSVTPGGNGELQVCFWAAHASNPVLAAAAGTTQRGAFNSATSNFGVVCGDVAAPASGVASATYTATVSSGTPTGWCAQTVLLIPIIGGFNPRMLYRAAQRRGYIQ